MKQTFFFTFIYYYEKSQGVLILLLVGSDGTHGWVDQPLWKWRRDLGKKMFAGQSKSWKEMTLHLRDTLRLIELNMQAKYYYMRGGEKMQLFWHWGN